MVNGLELLKGTDGNTLSVMEMMLAQAQKEKALRTQDQQLIQSETKRRSYETMKRLITSSFVPRITSYKGPPERKSHRKTKKKIVTRRSKGGSK